MNDSLAVFTAHRPRLFGIAYRMLGSRLDAEDVLQDAYLRWHQSPQSEVVSPQAWLVTTVTRLCIDRLRSARAERERYPGPWLPEPLVADEGADPAAAVEFAADLSLAFLTVLERLAPEERAAFLLREVFDTDYADIARMLAKNEPACRQLVSRARQRVRLEQPRFRVDEQTHRQLLDRFIEAARAGDHFQLQTLFAADAVAISDGGGKVVAAQRPLRGADRLATLYCAIFRNYGDHVSFEPVLVNGEPGVLICNGGRIQTVVTIATDGRRIHAVYAVRNPDKLRGITLAA